jgi:hypothetical protein
MNKIPAQDAKALRWCGVLGHTYVVLRTVKKSDGGDERCSGLETCDRNSAITAARTEYRKGSPAVYQQVERGKWRPVTVPSFKLTPSQWGLLRQITKANETNTDVQLKGPALRTASVLVQLGLLEPGRQKVTATGWELVQPFHEEVQP